MLGGVGGELMQSKRKRLSGSRMQQDIRTRGGDSSGVAGAVGTQLLIHKLGEIRTLPTRLR
jgi:hypothetical protein